MPRRPPTLSHTPLPPTSPPRDTTHTAEDLAFTKPGSASAAPQPTERDNLHTADGKRGARGGWGGWGSRRLGWEWQSL